MKKQSTRRSKPTKLRAIQTSRHLRVVQHQHTGHVTHRRTTSYPTLLMIVLCVGVFLFSWTRFVGADAFVYPGPVTNSYEVHASVPGPAPTVAATIDSPTDGAKFTGQPITVSGSCPLSTYVTLYRNGAFSGVALCQVTGSWQLQTSLFAGTNQLQAKVFSSTDVPGPLSAIVTVTYTPPVPAVQPGTEETGSSTGSTPSSNNRSTTNSSGPVVKGEPLIFKTNFVYEGHYVGATSTWQLDIEGGRAPYAVSVDWGDGQQSLISRQAAGTFSVTHVYHKPGGYRGSYVTKFSASDADNSQTLLQLLAIVNNPPDGEPKPSSNSGVQRLIPGVGSSGGSSKGGSGGTQTYMLTLLKYIWPGYAVVVLMLFSFWLGERRELNYLKPRFKKTHPKVRHA